MCVLPSFRWTRRTRDEGRPGKNLSDIEGTKQMNIRKRTARKGLAKQLTACFCILLMLASFSAPVFPQAAAANTSQQTVLEPTLKSAYSKKVYLALREELDAVIKEKGFSNVAKKFLREILLNKLKNYNQWRTGYLDMPNAKDYLRENLIDALKNVKSITLINEDSQRAKEMIAKGWAAGETDADFNIVVLYRDPAKLLPEDHLEDLEKLDHEIKHCKDKKVIFKIKHYKNNYDLRDLLVEGGATFHQKFVSPLSACQAGTWTIGDSKSTKSISYEKSNCSGYLLHLSLYETLVYLAGYRTVENVSMGRPVLSIKEEITNRYGAKIANRIWKDMISLHSYYEDEGEGIDLYAFAVDLQQQVMKCIKKDIGRLNEKKPKQVRKYMEVYRYYKLKVMPKIYKKQYTDITASVFHTETLDQQLVNKIIASNALPQLINNAALNRSALLSMLYTTTRPLSGKRQFYVPPTISNTRFLACEKGTHGKMIVKYTNESREKVQVVFVFGKEGIQKVYSQ